MERGSQNVLKVARLKNNITLQVSNNNYTMAHHTSFPNRDLDCNESQHIECKFGMSL